VFSTLRDSRYRALSLLMLVIALGCIAAGTWQVLREKQKHDANNELRANAHAPTVAVTTVLPAVGTGQPPRPHSVQYRTVTVTGRYDAAHQALVRNRTVNDDTGYLLVTPLRGDTATLLVVRGFISGSTTENVTAPPPPPGVVTITGRVQPAETRADRAQQLPSGQVESINPGQQATRLGTPVFDGYVELLAGQAGTEQLTAIPAPDLSNPAGGAVEPQHIAYIIQWFLFAGLAIAAPFVMARSERRQESDDFAQDGDRDAAGRNARLADRYGRSIR
jgi:cytochrome oxidase assembly protein ShyY1